jgi:hypothetical protein
MTVVKRLAQKYASRATEWRAGRIDLAKIQAWIEESNRLARDVAHSPLSGFACRADMEQTRIALSEDYPQHAGAVVEEQSAKAGHHLATILNRALGD